MVGRYINQEFRQFDRPVVRFGNLAMLPKLVHQRERSFDQESFLVDMRSHSGFSGSPVFVYYEDLGWREVPPLPEMPPPREYPPLPESLSYEENTKEIDARYNERVADLNAYGDALKERVAGREMSGIMGQKWLLGIEWGHLPVWDDVFDGNQTIGRIRVSTGMAGVVPAWKLTDLLNGEGMKMAREKTEKQLSEKDGGSIAAY